MFKNLLIFSFMIPLLCHDICAQDLLTTGARPLGMGGVFTSIADDANAVFWNAAGLPGLQRIEASGTHAKPWNAQIISQQAILVFPFTGKFALGLGLNNISLGKDEQLDFHQTVFNGALGYQLCPFLALGANLKYLDFGAGLNSASTGSLFKESETGFGFDAGLLLSWPHNDSSRLFLKDFQVGFTVRDIRDTDIKFDSGAEDKVFLESYRVGLAWTPAQKRIFGLPSLPVLAFEFNPEERWHLGGELSLITGPKGFLRRLSLRAGTQNDWHRDEGATYSFGGGFRVALGSIGLLQLDYTYIYPPSLPASHRIGFSFLFKTLLCVCYCNGYPQQQNHPLTDRVLPCRYAN